MSSYDAPSLRPGMPGRQRKVFHQVANLSRDASLSNFVRGSLQNVRDVTGNKSSFFRTKPPGRDGRSAQPNAAGLSRRASVTGNRVLIASNADGIEQLFGLVAAEAEGPDIN